MEVDEPENDLFGATTAVVTAGNAKDHHGETQAALSSPPGRTLLPGPIASMVSLATRSTSFALRLGTVIGGYGLGAAKFTTLSSLELGRGILEGILSRAGKDVLTRSQSELGRDSAESVLERSLESLHQTMLHMVFWTTAGFGITETTASSLSQISQLLLSTLDQFFGSTDSSRAIASIITLIRHEFRNPATGVPGETVGVVDLVIGLCGLAYLQNSCRRTTQAETRRLGHEEIVWDVVVFNDGTRADIHEDSLSSTQLRNNRTVNRNSRLVEALEQHGSYESNSEEDLPEIQLRREILKNLPKTAKVSISTSTTTTKIITVEVEGHESLPLLAPPGADLIEREVRTPDTRSFDSPEGAPTYRLVYKVSRERQRNSILQHPEAEDTRACIELVDEEDHHFAPGSVSPERGPPVPPKSPRTSQDKSHQHSTREPTVSVGSVNTKTPSSPRERSSQIPVLKQSPDNAANQKKARQPLKSSKAEGSISSTARNLSQSASRGAGISDLPSAPSAEKRSGIRNVLKKGSVTGLASLLGKDPGNEEASNKSRPNIKSSLEGSRLTGAKSRSGAAQAPGPNRNPPFLPKRDAPRPAQRGNPNFFSSRDLGVFDGEIGSPRSRSRTNLVGGHHRRNSIVSQTDTMSIHSIESRPGSPTLYRAGHMSKSKSGDDITHSPQRHHNATKSQLGMYTPSVYTLQTSSSQTSLVLPSYHQRSAYGDSEAVDTLRHTGMIDGMFPEFHMLRNITRYSRHASAAYGSHFLNLMGIAKETRVVKVLDDTHQDVRSFANHTELPPNSILLSSFVDPQGGSDSTGSTETGVPLVHTVAIDRESKAIVLACRGTLGFEDVLADMMCDYDDLIWRGKAYKVHKGIHASARRLLYGGDGRVLYTLKEALEEFSDFGLVLCGHSLGGAVAALLGAMLAEPATNGTAFVTSAQQHKRLISDGHATGAAHQPICLPAGRAIHVFAYGPPATMSPSLRLATRGLITSIVHGNDLVPYLSLGVLHDLQALALAFKTDNSEAKAEVRRRILQSFQTGLSDKWYNNAPKLSTDDEEQWAYAALKTLRASMMSSKLLPPGEVFAVESTPVLRRDAFVQPGGDHIGRSATRIVLKYIRDVDAHFREIRFGASMLTDHSPGRYEDALRRLTLGVI